MTKSPKDSQTTKERLGIIETKVDHITAKVDKIEAAVDSLKIRVAGVAATVAIIIQVAFHLWK